jgi:cation diffusion facilitator family transporter
MDSIATTTSAEQEKRSAAGTSVIAAICLTLFKIVVGLMTNSLGILAEAAHSGLDLVAALVTFLAVRISGKPADKEHPYGHGKVENLSALFETLLLLATCVWIIYEAIQRLFFSTGAEITPSIWAFIVMGTSIFIDFTRSRILFQAAKKHNSQALEADALHFSTDIWSSTVVIIGLAFVLISDKVPSFSFLHQADSIAALGVALIVVYVSVQLGKRTIEGLLDTAPDGVSEKVKKAAESVPGVLNCHNIRMRASGPDHYADVHILVDKSMPLEDVHALMGKVEAAVNNVLPGTDITVHPEPASAEGENSVAVER